MALPSGYTELEYIKSSGTQYINTGFKPNNNTRIVCSMQFSPIGTWKWLFSGRTAASSAAIGVATTDSSTQIRSEYGSETHTFSQVTSSEILNIDINKNMYTINTEMYEFSPSTWQSSANLCIFARCTNGTIDSLASAYLYSEYQVYDNGQLVRNYIPCQNPSGEVGMYDEVGEQFYGNAGTGTFEAGPIVIPDEGIASLQDAQLLISSDNATIELELVVIDPTTSEAVDVDVESVSGTVNGAATTWTLSGGLWTATAPLSEMGQYLCVFDVATSDGKTVEMRLPLYYGVLSLITDRAQSDVDELLSLLRTPFADWTTEQAQLFYSGMSKGAYNASDLNRVGAAMVYIAERISSMGYAVADIAPKLYWMDTDVVTQSDMGAYLSDVASLQAVLPLPDETPTAPSDIAGLTYTEANNIEQILTIINTMLTNITLAYMYAGELYGGEV